jgi:hypothetical protein
MTSQKKCDIHFSTGLGPKPQQIEALKEENVLLQIEKAQQQILIDGLTKIIEEFCKDEIERRSHLGGGTKIKSSVLQIKCNYREYRPR